MDVKCNKTGKNTVVCMASDVDTIWRGRCTKHKDGTWSCVQIQAGATTELRKIPPELRKALLDVKPKRTTRRKARRAPRR
jgi:hypothetical protein